MSVYNHNYRPYSGRLTAAPARIRVLARYGMAEAWSSKITVCLVLLGLLPFLVSMVGIYLANNPMAQALILKGRPIFVIDASFFLKVLVNEGWLALVLCSWVAPRLITFDLADNALPILLSHPVSRSGYVFGKLLAMMAFLSAVTWIPGVLLFAFQGYSSPHPWVFENLRIAAGLVAGASIWIVFLSLLGLALSSWVKWRAVATGIIFAAVLVPAGIGGMVTAVLRTRWGFLLNVPYLMVNLWRRLLGMSDGDLNGSLPTPAICASLALAALLFVAMLNTRIRARAVVKG